MRYFYTDPLAAAWMAKHFGMNFYWIDPEAIAPGDFSLELDDLISEITNKYIERFYVHAQSVHLLEPREADLYACDTACGWLATTPGESWIKQIGHFRIIQRNGIAFMWPESEGT